MVMIVFNTLLIVLTIPYVLSQDLLKSQFPLYGLTEVAVKRSLKLETVCSSQLKSIHNAIKKHETWALRLLDSSGSPVNGFIWGNNYWLGTYSQCRWLSSKKSRLALTVQESLTSPPFGVDFYISLFKQNTSLQAELDAAHKDVIHLGLCLPSACSQNDLEQLLTLWAKQNSLSVQNLYNFTMEFQKVRIVRPDHSWIHNPLTYILSVIITVALLLTLSGTIYDIYVWKPLMKRIRTDNNSNKINNKNSVIIKTRNIQECSDLLDHDNNLNNSYELKIDNSQHKSMPVHIIKPEEITSVEERGQGFFGKLCLCFSATSNIKIIFDTPETEDEFCVIHGLRFLGMIWLIWLYSVFYLKDYSDNKPLAQRLSEGFSENIISNSTFSVDTFFFTSGFLLAFKYYRNRRGSFKTDRNFSVKKKVNEFSLMALKRFLRLTPVYAVVLAVVIISVKSMRQTSLFEMQEPADEICQKYWWRNLAYINNLYQGDEMCMPWSWYLSTDMQFFLLGLFILILSTRIVLGDLGKETRVMTEVKKYINWFITSYSLPYFPFLSWIFFEYFWWYPLLLRIRSTPINTNKLKPSYYTGVKWLTTNQLDNIYATAGCFVFDQVLVQRLQRGFVMCKENGLRVNKFWKFASVVATTLVIMSSLLTGYLSYGDGYFPPSHPQLALLHVIHYSPWTRVGPYLIGMFTGYLVVHLKGELVFKKTVLITCWLIWSFCNIWALFGLYRKNMSLLSTVLHTALSRTAWGFSLSWIVIACCTQNAGAIKAILSYPGWIPFSRLSYSSYLLSPLIITLIASNTETAMHFDSLQLVLYFFGHLGIIYFCAFFFSLILEIPVTSLTRRAIGQRQTQNQLN